MYQVRFHGRGGQGVVTAAELLSVTAFLQQRHAQAFPSFGSERMGAPVASFCRIDDKPIRTREPIYAPDALIVQDASLLSNSELLTGCENAKLIVINSPLSIEQIYAPRLKEVVDASRLVPVPATDIAMSLLRRNVPNLIMLSAFGALSGQFELATLERAIRQKFPTAIAELNCVAAGRVWKLVRERYASEAQSQPEAVHA